MDPDWNLLPAQHLRMISEKLTSISDFVRFRAVCPTWRSASLPNPRHLPPQLPWLILPRRPILGSSLFVYDISQSKTHTLYLSEIEGNRICGSSHGWLALEKERLVWLFNPITRDRINLPSLQAPPIIGNFIQDGFILDEVPDHLVSIKKVILSSNPRMDPNCIVMVLFSGVFGTAYCRIGEEQWTTNILDYNIVVPLNGIDISYHNGIFYTVHGKRRAWIHDFRNPRVSYGMSTNCVTNNEGKLNTFVLWKELVVLDSD